MTQRPPRPTPIINPLPSVPPQTPGIGPHAPNIPPPNVTPLPPAPAPAPPKPEPEPPKDGTPASYTSRNSVIYSFATQQYTCLQCSTALYGGHCIDLVMRNGYGLGHENAWLRRIPCRDGDNQRCDIC